MDHGQLVDYRLSCFHQRFEGAGSKAIQSGASPRTFYVPEIRETTVLSESNEFQNQQVE